MYRFKPNLGIKIYRELYEKNISAEEAAVSVIREFYGKIKENRALLKNIFRSYENVKKAQLNRETVVIPATGQKYEFRPISAKSKKNYALFLRFYRAAKRDLKSKGRISEKTLAMIK